MYVILAPIEIKPGFKDRFVEEMLGDARGSVNNEPGCLRFDVIQDSDNPDKIWLYEVYKDEAAFQEHEKAPHFIKWLNAVKDWRVDGPPEGTIGGRNIWPPDQEWV